VLRSPSESHSAWWDREVTGRDVQVVHEIAVLQPWVEPSVRGIGYMQKRVWICFSFVYIRSIDR
jgi:hypothetical protein